MYKRRDWIFTHNPDTGAISSDSDSDSDGGGDSEVADSETGGTEDGSSEDGFDEEAPRTMEHLQGMLESSDEEEDEEADGQLTSGADTNRSHPSGGGKAIDPEALDDQKMAWLQVEGSERPKGVPLRCLLCKNKLLISSDVFRQHLTSKAHLASAKRHGVSEDQLKQLDSIVPASTVRIRTEDTETHAQRIERFQQIKESLDNQARKKQQGKVGKPDAQHSAPSKKPKACKQGGAQEGSSQEQGGSTARQGKAKRKRNKKEPPAGGKKKGKPGKRQREALKAAAAATAAAGSRAGGATAT